ncbi:synaptonemal complex protein, putative [Entamoeba invadens IP1]|uniref:Synaptonemal complex protein, putative n=1 Tax=Entamoeba invadens IP1 TaxID=370355 RepID=A0A0A1U607_ENTIV|nr:synaptonemal complex protein, putative [Entamoeba invadens IP1]ELP87266.1 synaptonemal complex protein, putative [Entamoeba invadens IP1]|eukprot:XP_004254037.1 synaptonemal complex protein, putative [Entamoeba invadens IP1]
MSTSQERILENRVKALELVIDRVESGNIPHTLDLPSYTFPRIKTEALPSTQYTINIQPPEQFQIVSFVDEQQHQNVQPQLSDAYFKEILSTLPDEEESEDPKVEIVLKEMQRCEETIEQQKLKIIALETTLCYLNDESIEVKAVFLKQGELEMEKKVLLEKNEKLFKKCDLLTSEVESLLNVREMNANITAKLSAFKYELENLMKEKEDLVEEKKMIKESLQTAEEKLKTAERELVNTKADTEKELTRRISIVSSDKEKMYQGERSRFQTTINTVQRQLQEKDTEMEKRVQEVYGLVNTLKEQLQEKESEIEKEKERTAAAIEKSSGLIAANEETLCQIVKERETFKCQMKEQNELLQKTKAENDKMTAQISEFGNNVNTLKNNFYAEFKKERESRIVEVAKLNTTIQELTDAKSQLETQVEELKKRCETAENKCVKSVVQQTIVPNNNTQPVQSETFKQNVQAVETNLENKVVIEEPKQQVKMDEEHKVKEQEVPQLVSKEVQEVGKDLANVEVKEVQKAVDNTEELRMKKLEALPFFKPPTNNVFANKPTQQIEKKMEEENKPLAIAITKQELPIKRQPVETPVPIEKKRVETAEERQERRRRKFNMPMTPSSSSIVTTPTTLNTTVVQTQQAPVVLPKRVAAVDEVVAQQIVPQQIQPQTPQPIQQQSNVVEEKIIPTEEVKEETLSPIKAEPKATEQKVEDKTEQKTEEKVGEKVEHVEVKENVVQEQPKIEDQVKEVPQPIEVQVQPQTIQPENTLTTVKETVQLTNTIEKMDEDKGLEGTKSQPMETQQEKMEETPSTFFGFGASGSTPFFNFQKTPQSVEFGSACMDEVPVHVGMEEDDTKKEEKKTVIDESTNLVARSQFGSEMVTSATNFFTGTDFSKPTFDFGNIFNQPPKEQTPPMSFGFDELALSAPQTQSDVIGDKQVLNTVEVVNGQENAEEENAEDGDFEDNEQAEKTKKTHNEEIEVAKEIEEVVEEEDTNEEENTNARQTGNFYAQQRKIKKQQLLKRAGKPIVENKGKPKFVKTSHKKGGKK